MLLAPSIWNLLGQLRAHLDITLDVLDVSFEPLLPPATDAGHGALRLLASDDGPRRDGVRPRRYFVAALRTGQHQVFDVDGLRVGLFPLRHDRDVVGLLVTASRETEAQAERRVERLGWALRSALEADIVTQARLVTEHRQSRWLTGTFRFLEHLYATDDERAMFSAVVEAAAVWGDFDARVYRRDLAGRYVLEAALPSVTAPPESVALPALLLETQGRPTRLSSMAEVEHLGWGATTQEGLLVPLQRADEPEGLLVIGGPLDSHHEQVFTVVGQVLALRLEALKGERQRRLQGALRARLDQRDLRFNARLAAVLRDVSSAVHASHARVLVPEGIGQAPRILAAVGGSPLANAPSVVGPDTRLVTAQRLVLPVSVTAFGGALLDLGTAGTHPFDHADLALATAALEVIRPWLAGALDAFAEAGRGGAFGGLDAGFEARIEDEIERAKRFKLPAGLLVIDTHQLVRERHAIALAPVVGALKAHLRSSDLIGRLRDGDLAALLVQTAPQGVVTVAGRVERELMRLSREVDLPPTSLGKAVFPIAGENAADLLAAARSDLRRAPVGRA